MERALLIEFDLESGIRAGNINPKDPDLPCRGWQNLESRPALEIRRITDDRDTAQYEGIQGVTVLEGKGAINQAITDNIPIKYSIGSEAFLLEHMKEKNLSLSKFKGKNMMEIAKEAHKEGLAGVTEKKPKLLE